MIQIVAIDTPSLGDRGYLVTDGAAALVIDAQRDFDRILAVAQEHDVPVTHVLETHIHNDYVTGGYALARETGAQYLVNGADPVSFERTPVTGGDVLDVGAMRVRVLATPGHTFTHLSYVLQDGDQVLAVFTGGSLLAGSTGRPDLLGDEHKVALARAQHASARRLARELPESTWICPTHGFGSFCSATAPAAAATGPAITAPAPAVPAPSPAPDPAAGPLLRGGGASTMAAELRVNPALTSGETEYVATTLAGLDDFPAYYAQMGPANLAGPPAPDLSPPPAAGPEELRRRIRAGEWVVDLRDRAEFAAGHLPGTLNFGLGPSLATYLGWLIPRGTPLTLLGRAPADIAAAQRELVRIGIDRPAAAAAGDPADWAAGAELAQFATADFAELARETRRRPLIVLDVRRRSEWEGWHIDGALHIPLHELRSRMAQIPLGEIWVHCQAGYRAAVAVSMLAACGRKVVAIDDELSRSRVAGLAGAGTARG
ncbi:MAG TPA: MBL fold metallo-hydrolase [Streptosporangiaceae bacterium]|nr:MBL fold metallo-hydrolase [Streptosporangiaceae bacterium]